MKTVYLFGAGTSAWANVPLTANFRRVADSFRLPSEDEHIIRRFANDREDQLFCEGMFFWEALSPEADVEQFYLMAELADRLGLDDEAATFHDLRCAQYVIAKTVEQTAFDSKRRRIHDKMLEHVHARGQSTFITLNWDLTLDTAVSRSAHFRLDYGIEGVEHLGTGPEPLVLLKMHGSLNWMMSSRGYKLVQPTLEKSTLAYWEEEPPDEIDFTKPTLRPLFIPPTSQKLDEMGGPITEVWRKARTELMACDRLVIVGYSFPPADAQMRAFVIEALSKNGNNPTIEVVSSPKHGTQRVQFEDRYVSTFEGSTHFDRLSFHYVTYEDWVERWKCSFRAPDN